MALPNYQADVAAAAARYHDAWQHAHRDGDPRTEEFIRQLAADLHAKDPNVGLNGKRGNPNDISDDALAVYDPNGDVTDRTGQKMFIIDCIGGAGGPNPQPAWASVGGPSPGAWVKPAASVPGEPPAPKPPTPPTPQQPPFRQYPGDHVFDAIGETLFHDFAEAGQAPNPAMVRWAGRTMYDYLYLEMTMPESIAKHRMEWRAALGVPPV